MKKEKTIIRFMSQRFLAMGLSLLLILVSIVSLFVQGLNPGLDFTGGIAIELDFEKTANLDEIRNQLKNSEKFSKAQVQHYGNDRTVMVKVVDTSSVDIADTQQLAVELEHILEAVKPFGVKKVDVIGPAVGDDLRDQSGLALLVSIFLMTVYVSVRFSLKFAISAALGLVHDGILVFGFFSLTQIDFDLTVLAAVLAVLGYSLNDTIVVSDRIRENFRAMRMETPMMIIDKSLTQVLDRTIITSGTTLFVVISLYLLGGEMLKGFSVALFVGIVVATYSSIYISSSLLLTLKLSKQDFIEIKPEAADSMP